MCFVHTCNVGAITLDLSSDFPFFFSPIRSTLEVLEDYTVEQTFVCFLSLHTYLCMIMDLPTIILRTHNFLECNRHKVEKQIRAYTRASSILICSFDKVS